MVSAPRTHQPVRSALPLSSFTRAVPQLPPPMHRDASGAWFEGDVGLRLFALAQNSHLRAIALLERAERLHVAHHVGHIVVAEPHRTTSPGFRPAAERPPCRQLTPSMRMPLPSAPCSPGTHAQHVTVKRGTSVLSASCVLVKASLPSSFSVVMSDSM